MARGGRRLGLPAMNGGAKEFLDNLTVDLGLQYLTAFVLVLYIFSAASLFEVPYPSSWVHMFAYPYWRFLVIATVALAGYWSRPIGVLAAVAAFFYFNDMDTLSSPFLNQTQ